MGPLDSWDHTREKDHGVCCYEAGRRAALIRGGEAKPQEARWRLKLSNIILVIINTDLQSSQLHEHVSCTLYQSQGIYYKY